MRVLIVEDDEALGDVIRRGLEAHGIETALTRDAAACLHTAAGGNYDAIVLDLLLPGMNGLEVLRHLRDREVLTPVVVLTARDQQDDEALAFTLGADAYMTKPFSIEVLAARVRAIARR